MSRLAALSPLCHWLGALVRVVSYSTQYGHTVSALSLRIPSDLHPFTIPRTVLPCNAEHGDRNKVPRVLCSASGCRSEGPERAGVVARF